MRGTCEKVVEGVRSVSGLGARVPDYRSPMEVHTEHDEFRPLHSVVGSIEVLHEVLPDRVRRATGSPFHCGLVDGNRWEERG